MIKKFDKVNKFISMFDPKTGFYMRTGVLDENGKDTGVDPFMTTYPELLDIGIMQQCVCAHRCNVDCYQKAIERKGNNMSLEDFHSILEQCKGKTFQCLGENEIVLVKNAIGHVQSKCIKNVEIGDIIYCGDNNFSKVVDKLEKEAKVYDIELTYGKHIFATAEHKFPTTNGLKTVENLKPGETLLHTKNNFNIDVIHELDIVKMIINNNLGQNFYLSDCPGLSEVCKKYNIYRNTNKTVQIERIKDYLSEIDYSRALITRERSQYRLNTIYPITNAFMILLGHYIGNGSKRTYVVSSSQMAMIEAIEKGLQETFPNFIYNKSIERETCRIELTSTILHELLFDKIFNCRTLDREKQLPNFIFSLSKEHKLSFLRGYFCDGNLRIRTDDGNYGELIFNTSSEKLSKDICLLLASLDIDYSMSTEEGKKEIFSKKEPRIINRKKRYRVKINNLLEITKLQNVAIDHKNGKLFNQTINQQHEDKCLRERKGYEIKKITKVENIANVVDINIDSNDHLFITSHGIITHNCALGGAGDVDTHENFEELVKLCREYNIVPNFTTSGILMTKEKAEICKKYCGAVAVSEHFSDYTERALDLLLEAGVKTNIHYVLSNKSISIAIERLRNNSFKKGINAVVFLTYKPVGLGIEENMLRADDPRVTEFFDLIDNGNFHHKIGFDSCAAAGLVNFTKSVNMDSIDFCEGARYSAYIDANMNMMPCSFANQDNSWFINLREHTIQEAWDSEIFEKFRYSLKHSCAGCSNRNCCAGGCPLVNQITLCDRKERCFALEN